MEDKQIKDDGLTVASTGNASTVWITTTHEDAPVYVSSQWLVEEAGISNDKNELL